VSTFFQYRLLISYVGLWASPYNGNALSLYEGVSKSFRTEPITKWTTNTRWEATKRITEAKLTRLTHEIATQLRLVAESCTICSSRSRRPVRKLLDTPSYVTLNYNKITKKFKMTANGLAEEHLRKARKRNALGAGSGICYICSKNIPYMPTLTNSAHLVVTNVVHSMNTEGYNELWVQRWGEQL
jgi:hypothetical protein